MNALETNPSCDLAACDSMRVTADLMPLERLVDPRSISRRREEYFKLIWRRVNTFSGHNLVLRGSRKGSCIPFISYSNMHHDYWLIFYYSFINRFLYIDKVLTLYRIHENNATTPGAHGHGKNIFERLREIRKESGADLKRAEDLYLWYRDALLERIPAEQIPEDNLSFMNKSIDFFRWRCINHKRVFFLQRMISALFLLPGYFKYSNGLLSFIRDCIL